MRAPVNECTNYRSEDSSPQQCRSDNDIAKRNNNYARCHERKQRCKAQY